MPEEVLNVVRTKKQLGYLPKGAHGVVVYVYESGKAFDVEFNSGSMQVTVHCTDAQVEAV